MAKVNQFRFSTKYDDDETDFLYYGYRYYNPNTGRWLSRDMHYELRQRCGLYVFVANSPIALRDLLGRMPARWPFPVTINSVDNANVHVTPSLTCANPCAGGHCNLMFIL